MLARSAIQLPGCTPGGMFSTQIETPAPLEWPATRTTLSREPTGGAHARFRRTIRRDVRPGICPRRRLARPRSHQVVDRFFVSPVGRTQVDAAGADGLPTQAPWALWISNP